MALAREPLRAQLYRQLDPLAWPGENISPTNAAILLLVLLSIIAAVVQSEPTVKSLAPDAFWHLDLFFAALFSAEYAARMWTIGVNPKFAGWHGRMRFAASVPSMLDLLAVSALWFDILGGSGGMIGVLLRLARVLRVLTLTRNSHWAHATRLICAAIQQRGTELVLSFAFALVVLVVAATLLYFAEGQQQPEAFGSIPRAMWWAIATLTTVGYGDVYPITVAGKLCASMVALTSIAIVAMPTGIMASAFSDAVQELRRQRTWRGESGAG